MKACRVTSSALRRLSQPRGYFLSGGQLVPPPDQPAIPVENKRDKCIRAGWHAEARSDLAVKIRDCEKVLTRVAFEVFCRVNSLEAARFVIEPAPDECSGESTQRTETFSAKVYDSNHAKLRIPQVFIGDAIAQFTRFVFVFARDDCDDRRMPIGSREPVLINIYNRYEYCVANVQIASANVAGEQQCRD